MHQNAEKKALSIVEIQLNNAFYSTENSFSSNSFLYTHEYIGHLLLDVSQGKDDNIAHQSPN